MLFTYGIGSKISEKVKLKKKITYNELYDIISTTVFPCGKAVMGVEDITFTECPKYNIRICIDGEVISVVSKFNPKCFSASERKELRALRYTVLAIILDKAEENGY